MLAIRGSFRAIMILYVITISAALFFAYPPPGDVPPEGNDPATAGVFFVYLLLATAVFIAIIKLVPWIFKHIIFLLELIFLFSTTAVVVASYGLPETMSFLAVMVRAIWAKSVTVQNASTVVIASVATAVAGSSLSPSVAVIILAVLAVYDYISVFVTKHMVVLAKAVGAVERTRSAEKTHLLGAGDVAIPGIFAVSLLRVSPMAGVVAAIGASAGLVLTMRLAERWKRVLPALPTIALVELLMTTITLALL